MIRLHLQDDHFDVEDMGFDQASALHARGDGVFLVSARPLHGGSSAQFRRMSIAVDRVVSVEELQ